MSRMDVCLRDAFTSNGYLQNYLSTHRLVTRTACTCDKINFDKPLGRKVHVRNILLKCWYISSLFP